MKRTFLFIVCATLIVFLCLSCSAPASVVILDGFHDGMNRGSVDNALSYVAQDAVFKVNAAPIAGVNGVYVGHTEIGEWLSEVVDSGGNTNVFGMEISGDRLTCLLSYQDDSIMSLGLGFLDMEEVTVLSNGEIQSYTLSWLPSEEARFENALSTKSVNFRQLQPSDRKFFTSGYIAQPDSSQPWLHDITPADRKFFNEGYIWSR